VGTEQRQETQSRYEVFPGLMAEVVRLGELEVASVWDCCISTSQTRFHRPRPTKRGRVAIERGGEVEGVRNRCRPGARRSVAPPALTVARVAGRISASSSTSSWTSVAGWIISTRRQGTGATGLVPPKAWAGQQHGRGAESLAADTRR